MFIIYKKTDNKIIKALPGFPTNTDFAVERGDIWFDGFKVMGGVNWDNVNYAESDAPLVDADNEEYYYNPITGEITQPE